MGTSSVRGAVALGRKIRNTLRILVQKAKKIWADTDKMASSILDHRLFNGTIIGFLCLICGWLYYYPQDTGYSVAVLGGLGVVMTFFQAKATHKLLAIILTIFFVFMEFRSISVDRAKRDAERAAKDENFEKRMNQSAEQQRIEAEKRSAEADRQQREFEYLLEKDSTLFDNLTGGDSISYIAPAQNIECGYNRPWPRHWLSRRGNWSGRSAAR